MVGEFGILPIYLIQTFMIFAVILWISAQSVPQFVGKEISTIGRNSLTFLIVHGFLIATIFHETYRVLPVTETLWIYPAIFVASTIGNILAYRLLRKLAERTVLFSMKTARRIVAIFETVPTPISLRSER